MICFFILRVAFSVAIVAMVRPATENFNNGSSSPTLMTRIDIVISANLCPLKDIESNPSYYYVMLMIHISIQKQILPEIVFLKTRKEVNSTGITVKRVSCSAVSTGVT